MSKEANQDIYSPKANIVFDDNLIVKKKHITLGRIENPNPKGEKYISYFGVPLYVNVQKMNKNKELQTIQIKKFYFVTSDRNLWATNDKLISGLVKFSDEPLMDIPRWSLGEIDRFTDNLLPFEYIKPKELFDLIVQAYKEYCYYDDDAWYDLRAIWDIGTYFFYLFDAYPYFENNGLKGTGKTKSMALSSLIAFNSEVFVNPSGSAIFRTVERNNPTLYIDEAEKLFQQRNGKTETAEIVELLNAGWQKGASVPRVEKDENGKFTLKKFNAYCPKQLSSINGLQGATADRSITQIFLKPPKDDHRGDLWPTEEDERFRKIRDYLYPFALKYSLQIDALANSKQKGLCLLKEFDIKNRDWQIWKPLLCIAKVIDKEIYQKLGTFAEQITNDKINSNVAEDSWQEKLYSLMLELTEKEDQKLRPKKLKTFLDEKLKENGFKPSTKSIGWHLNKIGFKKYHARDGEGVYFALDYKTIYSVLTSQNLITETTQTTQHTQNTETTQTTQNNVVNEVNEVCEGNSCGEEKRISEHMQNLISSMETMTYKQLTKQFGSNYVEKWIKEGMIYEQKPNEYALVKGGSQ